MTNVFFKYLNWILKVDRKTSSSSLDKNETIWLREKGKKATWVDYNVSVFMTNRWLSMASKPIAQIINMTTNRWVNGDIDMFSKFLHCVTPRYSKRIEYIKKNNEESNHYAAENADCTCHAMEISSRELEEYNKTLAELNLITK